MRAPSPPWGAGALDAGGLTGAPRRRRRPRRCIKLALVHDVAESIVGDITPHCGVSDADKHAMEAAAVQQIQQMLGGASLAGERAALGRPRADPPRGGAHARPAHARAGDEIAELWNEYEQAQTEEARLVKDFDKVGVQGRWPSVCAGRPAADTSPSACPPPAQLEMILQAHEYESQQGMVLQEFFDSTQGKWRTELGRSWAEEIYRRRAAGQSGQRQ